MTWYYVWRDLRVCWWVCATATDIHIESLTHVSVSNFKGTSVPVVFTLGYMTRVSNYTCGFGDWYRGHGGLDFGWLRVLVGAKERRILRIVWVEFTYIWGHGFITCVFTCYWFTRSMVYMWCYFSCLFHLSLIRILWVNYILSHPSGVFDCSDRHTFFRWWTRPETGDTHDQREQFPNTSCLIFI